MKGVAADPARRHGITFFDGAYLALAREETVPLYTADGRLLVRVEAEDVRHIGEYVGVAKTRKFC